jgi:peptidoglycan/xylan/chitin deacetylase (PgdA/CDA1 family)
MTDRASRHSIAPAILMYHRIAVERYDPWRMCVSPARFGEQLEALQRAARVVPLRELQRRMVDGSAEPGSVAITFDDGYADNLLAGLPLLARHAAPATLFVATGYLGGEREFWWDELERLLIEPGDLPKTVTLELSDGPLRLDLGSTLYAGAERVARRIARRRSASAPPSARVAAFRAAWERLQRLPHAERWGALEALRVATRRAPGPRASRRQLTEDELLRLASDGLVEIGAHTVTHPALSLLSSAEQREEILGSVATLDQLLGTRVRGFSYPHGRSTEETECIARDAGLEYACASGPVAPRSTRRTPARPDPFALPRVLVPDIDADALLQMLAEAPRGG